MRPVVNLKTADGRGAVRGDRQRSRRPGARVRRRAVGRARRRPGARRLQREDVRVGAVPGVPARSSDTFDPNGLFNPGRIVDTPPITSHLRFGAGYATPAPATFFDFSEHGGFGRAVEMCSGVGLCRKTREGTMCPSYMVTRDEAHSTRGRANMLRLAMSGQLGDAKLSDARRARGARSVPRMPRLQERVPGRRRHGAVQERVPRRLLGSPRHVARARRRSAARTPRRVWGSRFAPLSNAIANSAAGAVGGGDDWSASIAGGRCRSGRGRRCRRRAEARPATGESGPQALLFADTFTESRRSGDRPRRDRRDECRRHRARGSRRTCCCGRPLISQGLLRGGAAPGGGERPRAATTRPTRGQAIVFVEPSCLSAVREDAPDLLRGELQRRARVVARQSVLFEEFLEARMRGRPRGAGA